MTDTVDLISVRDLPDNSRTKPMIAELKRIAFDANMYIMLGKSDDAYYYGGRCYRRAMVLLDMIRMDTF